MHKQDQKPIAARYSVQPREMQSWMHHLVYARNLCAHHSRLWDRVYAIKPMMPRASHWQPPHVPTNDRLWATLLALRHLLRRCPAIGNFADDWRDRVNAQLEAPPPTTGDPLVAMGMPLKWIANPVWT